MWFSTTRDDTGAKGYANVCFRERQITVPLMGTFHLVAGSRVDGADRRFGDVEYQAR